MHTCAFSLSIFMSFFYTSINERLAVAQGRVPLAYVTHTGTRCAPVPIRFYLHVAATQNKKMRDWYLLSDDMRTCAFSLSIFMSLLYTTRNERLEVTQGRDVHLCLRSSSDSRENASCEVPSLRAMPPYLSSQCCATIAVPPCLSPQFSVQVCLRL